MNYSKMQDPKGNQILAIFYHHGEPHSVFTGNSKYSNQYDFNPCPKDFTGVYDHSGSGPGAYWHKLMHPKPVTSQLWVKPGVNIRYNSTEYIYHYSPSNNFKRSRKKFRKAGWELLKYPLLLDEGIRNPFSYYEEGEAVYCQTCECYRSVGWCKTSLCDHIFWCEIHGNWAGIGTQYKHNETCTCTEPKIEN